MVFAGAGPLALAQTPSADASKKALPACKGTSRASWNKCAGTYTSTDGAVYVGEFRSGKYNGKGSATWPNGDRYVGEFLNDQFHGQGVYTGEKSFVYVGEFREGKFNGIGTYTSSSGMKYVGEWRDDEKHGQGTYTWPSGRVYIGQFREDERDGQGSETMPDGTEYVGEFRESKRWGAGTLYDADGLYFGTCAVTRSSRERRPDTSTLDNADVLCWRHDERAHRRLARYGRRLTIGIDLDDAGKRLVSDTCCIAHAFTDDRLRSRTTDSDGVNFGNGCESYAGHFPGSGDGYPKRPACCGAAPLLRRSNALSARHR